MLSAMRHRAAELGDRCQLRPAATPTARPGRVDEPLDVVPPDLAGRRCDLVDVGLDRDVQVLPARGFATAQADFAALGRRAAGGTRLLMEDFYRDARRRLDVLMDGGRAGRRPVELRRRQPRAAAAGDGARSASPEPWWPDEDEIDDAGPRATWTGGSATATCRSSGADGPRRFAATRAEALAALRRTSSTHRLPAFGPHEDAMLRRRPVDGALAAVGAAEPRAARPARGRAPAPRTPTAAGDAPLRVGRGLRPPGDRLARLRLAPVLAPRARTTAGATRCGAPAPIPAWFADAGRRRDVEARVPVRRAARRARARLGAPHPAADGARQLRAAARLGPGRR